MNDTTTSPPAIPEIEKQLKTWSWQTSVFRLIHAALGITAIVSSLLVAAKLTLAVPLEWLALIAAVSVGLMSGFNLGAKANSMRRAWRSLNAALLKYKHGVDTSAGNLIAVYAEAEAIIGDVKADVK